MTDSMSEVVERLAKAICCPTGVCRSVERNKRDGGKYITQLPCSAPCTTDAVQAVFRELSAMGLVVVPEKVIEDARAVLEWDGGHRSKGYDASKSYDARERLHAHFTASPKVQP